MAMIRIAKEAPDSWWHGPWRLMMTDLMVEVHGAANEAGRVPIDTGHLRDSLQPGAGVTDVDPNDPAKWARVGTNVDYGGYLDGGDQYHYRGGPSQGKPTKGWLSDLPNAMSGTIDGIVNDFVRSLPGAFKSEAR